MVNSRGKPNKLREKPTLVQLCPTSNAVLNQRQCTVKRNFAPEIFPRI